MKKSNSFQNPLHDEVMELLPWYVNGTLDSEQKTRVEQHLRDCIVCHRELAIERRTLDAFHNESPVDQSAHAGFEHLQARIAGSRATARSSPARRSGTVGQWVAILQRYIPGLNRRSALIAVPVCVVAVAFGLLNVVPGDVETVATGQDSSRYQTLSSSKSDVANHDDVHVIFDRNTDSETIRERLDALQAEIIAGPNSAGAFTVRLLEAANDQERQAAILALRGYEEVLFAEPAQPMAVPQIREE